MEVSDFTIPENKQKEISDRTIPAAVQSRNHSPVMEITA
jgi:hypothetical protein